MKQILSIIFICYISISCSAQYNKIRTDKLDLFDSTRNRSIPTNIYYNSDSKAIGQVSQIKVIIISHGYGLKNTEYSFISERLAELGYFVIAIQHDLLTDNPLARTGNIYELRKPDWERGIQNINFVISELRETSQRLDFNNLILIGHSNGGDISMLFCTKYPDLVAKAISLDNLRMPIPRLKHPPILSIRARDTKADSLVIPCVNEQKELGIKIVGLKNGKHNELCDNASPELKQEIIFEICKFLDDNR